MEKGDLSDSSTLLGDLVEARKQIAELKEKLHLCKQKENFHLPNPDEGIDREGSDDDKRKVNELCNKDIRRYSRQLILPEIGVKGQLALINSSVLLVGAGGLGCPSAIYLAAAGVGHIGVVDYDEIELDNLHRQVLHTEERLGKSKCKSVADSIHCLNSSIVCKPHHIQLDQENALPLIKQYDIVLDCTDNVATRYLLNDACVLAGKPLVSASALRFEGQLTVYNHEGGPCYRCLFPRPPPPETVTNCSDGGVLGVVPGIMGNLQALEAIKIITGLKASYVQKLLLFDGLYGSFRSIKLRARKKDCSICGETPTVTGLIDYESFCGAGPSDKCMLLHILTPEERVTAKQLKEHLGSNSPPLLIDVRPPVEFDICHLPNSCNIPLNTIRKESTEYVSDAIRQSASSKGLKEYIPVIVICRRGNDSQLAVQSLVNKVSTDLVPSFKDVIGGLTAWAHQVDPNFPQY
ncbi:adenylyltransferase and sulfurtransferase MOCS3-like isoform X2 [Apostichopus japonicus]|uniref:adenylyltransferase and sulfurtransferase MOCS3-like isoform X2 n=1 Tax=Stichopus japonicus TaxID=307972 RepID=UPI003AB3277C